ncbi:hypothetical protein [Pseudonocardia sp. HH130629-09]|uniref:hypothetical protein n=1 Tax=Pseudonocardia sp. HH130629-09 TaxID=1641402 RepID=UPI0006CB5F85|nr:hypothetical protein [Pseudonocardia sp. HH130629-09]ALE82790.1 hypothetical protein XF36_06140 [Pseudonocardia sp. HH130629-09]
MDAGRIDGTGSIGVRVAATFALDPLVEPLERRLCAGPGSWTTLSFAPYGQLVRELLGPATAGRLVALIRWEDWFRYRTGGVRRADLDAVPEELLRAIRHHRVSRLLIVVCPPSTDAPDPTDLAGLDERIARTAPIVSGVEIAWARNWVSPGCDDDVRDRFSDRIAHVPYTDEFFEVLADRIVSWIDGRALAAGSADVVTTCGSLDAAVANTPTLAKCSVLKQPPGRIFELLADRAGPLHNGASLGLLAVGLDPLANADAGLAPGSRTWDALVTDLSRSVRAYRAECAARLLLVLPERPAELTPAGNLAHHAFASLRMLIENLPGVLVSGADPAILAVALADVGEIDATPDIEIRGGVA